MGVFGYCSFGVVSDAAQQEITPLKPHPQPPVMNTINRIRIVIGAMSVCLGWMEYLAPSQPSGKWGALHRFVLSTTGEEGYAITLLMLGILLIAWSVVGCLVDWKRASLIREGP